MRVPQLSFLTWSILLLLAYPVWAFEPSGLLEIHYINVQQAGATLVIGPDGTRILMDAGKAGDTLTDYLASIGLTPTDGLHYTLAGHLDSDHIRGFDEVFEAGYDVFVRNYFNGSDKSNATILTYMAAASVTTAGAPMAVPLGTVIDLGDGATLEVVAVHGEVIDGTHVEVPDENDRSVAVLIRYGDFDFLWASDLGGGSDPACTDRAGVDSANVETPLAQALTPGGGQIRLSALGVDVLHVSHHGSEASTNSDWMNLLAPEVAIVSAGTNSQGNPEPVVIDEVLRAGADCITAPPALVLQTDEGDLVDGSTTGFVVGDVVVMSDGWHFGLGGTGAVKAGAPDERGAAGLPAFYVVDEVAPDCPMVVALPEAVIHSPWQWKAKHSISNPGSFRVAAGGEVVLEAGAQVVLGNGFAVESGGSLTVAIEPLTDCSEP